MSADIYNDIPASINKWLTDFRQRNGLDNEVWDTYDYDAHATTDLIPAKNLLGVAEYSLVDHDETYTVTCMIVVCTQANDSGLKILRSTVGKLKMLLKPKYMLNTIKVDNGVVVGKLTVMPPVVVMALALTDGRPMIAIALQLAVGYLAPP